MALSSVDAPWNDWIAAEGGMRHVEAGGVEIPALGIGTFQLAGDACERAVREALELGYRHVDTGEYYDNERAVGGRSTPPSSTARTGP